MDWIKDNVVGIITILVSILGFFLACYQLWNGNKVKSAELLRSIIERLRFDEGIVDAFYMIEYGNNWYGFDFHETDGREERNIDGLLIYLSFVCYLRNKKLIKKSEFSSIEYFYSRVCSDFNVQAYLWNIYQFSKSNGRTCSFEYLIQYMKETGYIEAEEFEKQDNGMKKYPKYLNF